VVVGVVASGVATGLTVLVAQAPPERSRALLGTALFLGLAVSLPVAAMVAAAAMIAGVTGWLATIPAIVNGYWLGRERRAAMLALALFSAAAACAAALLAPSDRILEWLAWSQALPALALLFTGRIQFQRESALARFLLPGIAIGILSPLSLLAARSIVADAMSWHEAGVLQALWRVADWVCGVAGGFLAYHFLPRFAAAATRADLIKEMRRAAVAVLWPSAVAFGLAAIYQRELLALLYQDNVQTSTTAAALFFAGSLVRIVSWIGLFALYARHRTRAIALGELLSLPLFVVLLAVWGDRLTLEGAGAAWLLSFIAYAAFNCYWATRKSGV
jgi:PST family polysaccharide transporter